MKKLLIFSLVAIMCCALFFTGCENAKEPSANTESKETETKTENITEEDPENLSGGWSFAEEFNLPVIPEDAQAALDKALGELDGANYTAVAYLGSQVVAGTNYAFVCAVAPTVESPSVSLETVTVYCDLDGNASILSTEKIDISKYTENKDIDFSDMTGAFSVENAVGAALPQSVKTAFSMATQDLTGVKYKPLVCLGSQVVAGTNYAVLCKATSVTEEPKSALAVAVIYVNPKGGAELTSICGFNI